MMGQQPSARSPLKEEEMLSEKTRKENKKGNREHRGARITINEKVPVANNDGPQGWIEELREGERERESKASFHFRYTIK